MPSSCANPIADESGSRNSSAAAGRPWPSRTTHSTSSTSASLQQHGNDRDNQCDSATNGEGDDQELFGGPCSHTSPCPPDCRISWRASVGLTPAHGGRVASRNRGAPLVLDPPSDTRRETGECRFARPALVAKLIPLLKGCRGCRWGMGQLTHSCEDGALGAFAVRPTRGTNGAVFERTLDGVSARRREGAAHPRAGR
jgi:hypothetical protein